MSNTIPRRALIAGAAGSAAVLAGRGPSKASAPADIKITLYGITYLGLWYRGDPLTLEQVVQRAKKFGYDGVEIDGKRPHGCPIDWPKNRCKQFARYVADNGLMIAAVAANNDLSSPIEEHREAQVCLMRDMIRMTSDLGVKVIRVFLAWPGASKIPGNGGTYDVARPLWEHAHKDIPAEETWAVCRSGLVELARHAGEHGVTLALQNHKPVINVYQDMLRMIREVASPHLKACLDLPILEKKDPDYIRQAVEETGSLQVLSHFGGDYQRRDGAIVRARVGKTPEGQYAVTGYEDMAKDPYPVFVRALLGAGYRGVLSYELCHPLPMTNGLTVGIDFVDTCAQLAAEYMRGVIAKAKQELRS